MLKKNKVLSLVLWMAMIAGVANAQDLNESNIGKTPFSRYGYGSLAQTSYARNRGMGGIGYGLRSGSQINTINPASYTAIDSLTFLFDFGVNAKISTLKEYGQTQKEWDGGIDYLAMQFPIGKYMAATLGVQPFTYVGYSYGTTDSTQVVGSEDYVSFVNKYTGKGGLNQAFVGFAAKPFKHLSLGVNVGYIFGEISNTSSVTFLDNISDASLTYNNISVSALSLEVGAQVTVPLDKKNEIVVGAVYQPELPFDVTATYLRQTGSDTSEYRIQKHDMRLPQKVGAGVTYIFDKRLTVGADFEWQNWGGVAGLNDRLEVEDGLLRDKKKLSVGAEYLPAHIGSNYFQRIRYRAGMNISKSYIAVQDSRNDELGFSVGLGLPLKGQRTMLNLAFDYMAVTPENKTFLKENYFQFTLGINFNEMWFFKTRLK